jgi:2-polyprenyl-3-methyl-5-hydroxy-6-metoxy-1,4-benzoquinol methylase
MPSGLLAHNHLPAENGSQLDGSEQITASPRPACPFCGRLGDILHTEMVDWLNGVPESWGMRKCLSCAVAWLDPQPVADDIPQLYARYYTHHANQPATYLGRLQPQVSKAVLARLGYPVMAPKRILPRLLSYFPFAKRVALLNVVGLSASEGGSLLDVGCGNGELIARLHSLGWKVSGVDFDASAVSYARSQHLDVRLGTIADIQETERYDVIVLSHVIEHVADPVQLLRDCGKCLRPGTGRIIIFTPNINSAGHARFEKYWRGLEVPRHFILFSPAGLRMCIERAGLLVRSTSTETRQAQMIYKQSSCAKAGERRVAERLDFKISVKIAARVFRWVEDLRVRLKDDVGEEIFCVCGKPSP